MHENEAVLHEAENEAEAKTYEAKADAMPQNLASLPRGPNIPVRTSTNVCCQSGQMSTPIS